MAEPSSDDVIRMAQAQVAARRAAATALPEPRSDRGWRLAFAALCGAILLGLILWPGLPLHWKMYAAVHGVCAQVHNVDVGGVQLPLCARNTGIYMSFVITSVYLVLIGRGRAGRLPPIPILVVLILFVLIMAVDGFNSLLRDLFMPHLYLPRNDLRTLTGIGMGIALGVLLLLIVNVALRKNLDSDQRIIRNWAELGGAMVVNLLAWAAIYGNIGLLYWPIAITAWLGIVGVLFCVNLLIAAVIMRYENAVERFTQLARPATVALILTVIELGLMGWARFSLEAQGLIV